MACLFWKLNLLQQENTQENKFFFMQQQQSAFGNAQPITKVWAYWMADGTGVPQGSLAAPSFELAITPVFHAAATQKLTYQGTAATGKWVVDGTMTTVALEKQLIMSVDLPANGRLPPNVVAAIMAKASILYMAPDRFAVVARAGALELMKITCVIPLSAYVKGDATKAPIAIQVNDIFAPAPHTDGIRVLTDLSNADTAALLARAQALLAPAPAAYTLMPIPFVAPQPVPAPVAPGVNLAPPGGNAYAAPVDHGWDQQPQPAPGAQYPAGTEVKITQTLGGVKKEPRFARFVGPGWILYHGELQRRQWPPPPFLGGLHNTCECEMTAEAKADVADYTGWAKDIAIPVMDPTDLQTWDSYLVDPSEDSGGRLYELRMMLEHHYSISTHDSTSKSAVARDRVLRWAQQAATNDEWRTTPLGLAQEGLDALEELRLCFHVAHEGFNEAHLRREIKTDGKTDKLSRAIAAARKKNYSGGGGGGSGGGGGFHRGGRGSSGRGGRTGGGDHDSQNVRGAGFTGVCFKCNKQGHKASDCKASGPSGAPPSGLCLECSSQGFNANHQPSACFLEEIFDFAENYL